MPHQADSSSGFTFGIPLFLAFVAEFINKTEVANKNKKHIDIFKIITEAAGDKVRLPISGANLTNTRFTVDVQVLQWYCRSIYKKTSKT